MDTRHLIISCNASETASYLKDESVALVVTSPPYPMISMWDECFSGQDAEIGEMLTHNQFQSAFERMHMLLDKVWDEVDRVLIPGGIVCINIGDAVRSCSGVFRMFPNQARITKKFLDLGFCVLPHILWRKPSNSPNKYLGSGMYPPNAYITQEHEFILVFRKGRGREFKKSELLLRHQSGYFWDERNAWFSDLWTFAGISQTLSVKCSRLRSAAFPFELAYRLVNMFSIKGDLVYDPFCGTGTVARACMASERNSIGVDIDPELCESTLSLLTKSQKDLNAYITQRVMRQKGISEGLSDKYRNIHHGFCVKTKQETEILIRSIDGVEVNNHSVICHYSENPCLL